jgi:hypothetical protein
MLPNFPLLPRILHIHTLIQSFLRNIELLFIFMFIAVILTIVKPNKMSPRVKAAELVEASAFLEALICFSSESNFRSGMGRSSTVAILAIFIAIVRWVGVQG